MTTTAKFFKMPVELAARADLLASDKLLLAIIIDHIGGNGCGWPGSRLLSREAGMDRKTVLGAIGRLDRSGDLLVERRGNGYGHHYRVPAQTGGGNGPVVEADRSVPGTSTGGGNGPEAVQGTDRNQTDQGTNPHTRPKRGSVPYERVLSEYNRVCPPAGLPGARLTDKRREHIRGRWREPLFREKYREVFAKAAASSFCCGKGNGSWRADFGWLIQSEDNYVKVLEGKYDNPTPQGIPIREPTPADIALAEGGRAS